MRQHVSTTTSTVLPGGENGFSQAIELTADTLANVKFVQEKRLISRFFDEISQDTSKYTFGVKDTLSCLDMGAVETLIVWESLDVQRVTVLNPTTGACLYRVVVACDVACFVIGAACEVAYVVACCRCVIACVVACFVICCRLLCCLLCRVCCRVCAATAMYNHPAVLSTP